MTGLFILEKVKGIQEKPSQVLMIGGKEKSVEEIISTIRLKSRPTC